MRILYLFPGPLTATEGGTAELRRRQALLRAWASPDVTVDARDTTGPDGRGSGPISFETAYEGYLAMPAATDALLEAENDGYDAAILGCFGDPALDGIRERLKRLPVVGPGAASCHLAAQLGERFGLITTSRRFINPARRMIQHLGLAARCADIALIDQPPRSINTATMARIQEACLHLRASGADTLVLGCLTMGFLDVDAQLQDDVKMPVVNPGKAALYTAEMFVRSGLAPSKDAYPTPQGTAV